MWPPRRQNGREEGISTNDGRWQMRGKKMTGPLLLYCGVFLTGCQSQRSPPQLIEIHQHTPLYLFSCQDGPTRPAPEATQRDAALVIIDYQEALGDCKARLDALRMLFASRPERE